MARQKQNQSQKQEHTPPDMAEFAQNIAKATQSFGQACQTFMARQAKEQSDTSYDPFNLNNAMGDLLSQMMNNPDELAEKQGQLWQQYLSLWQTTAGRMMGEPSPPLIEPAAKDRRFTGEAWQENAAFDFLKQSYLLTTNWMLKTVHDSSGDMAPDTVRKLEFYTRQFTDAMSPSNFPMTNPEVLEATLESNGQNLVQGFANLLEDLEQGDGKLRIRMTDPDAFKLGENLAITKGSVIFENELMQLIRYAPTTKEVYSVPVLITPAWINKYYILDLKQANSLVKWLVDRGYTVFMISWVNPDSSLAKKTFEDYMKDGQLTALDVVQKATGAKQVSMIGYCLGGTLLASSLAWLAAKKQGERVASATYLTTMIDFSDAGDLSVFVDDGQLQQLESRMDETGYLDAADMSMTFNMLRSNDLIWSFVVNQYLLGKTPFPFDLLYWNMDSTRMPAAMHIFYLRNMYQKNLLAKPGGLTLHGEKIDLGKIKTPSYLLSAREDHIAPWQSTYAATQLYSGPVRFVLSTSGHVAGVINPPEKKKYSYLASASKTQKSCPKSADEWMKKTKETTGSWWGDWHKWHSAYAGEKIPASKLDTGKFKAIEAAPGRYVKVRY